MPPKRRASGPATKSQQSTLAFHGASNKVTKAGAKLSGAKKNILSDTKTNDPRPEVAEIVEIVEIEATEPTTVEADIIEQAEQEVKAQKAESTPDEDAARRLTDAAIKKYWAAKEQQRTAPRVHQQDLSLHEKILREFDMSGHYGVGTFGFIADTAAWTELIHIDMLADVVQPCTGVARSKRWKRAQRLDLDPPIEVLAVLLREQDMERDTKDKLAVQKSIVDDLLHSKTELDA